MYVLTLSCLVLQIMKVRLIIFQGKVQMRTSTYLRTYGHEIGVEDAGSGRRYQHWDPYMPKKKMSDPVY